MFRNLSAFSFVTEDDGKHSDSSLSSSESNSPTAFTDPKSKLRTFNTNDSSVSINIPDGWEQQKHGRMHLRTSSILSDADLKYSCPSFYEHPSSLTKEPFRDFSGEVTLHRLFLISWVVGVVVVLLKLEDLIWPPIAEMHSHGHRWFAKEELGYILLTPILFYIMVFVGAFWFKFNTKLDDVKRTSQRVVWRVVSRGLNKECINETVRKIRMEMEQNSLFPYLIEIVTDSGNFVVPKAADIIHLKVPPTYETPNGTKFKARSLHYACLASVVPGDSWIVHLDEETRPTSSAVKGIAAFITKCERNSDYKRIGQGCMLYHRSWKKFPLLTLADMRRTGDDFGHFYLQNRLGVANVGLHGAFIVCRAEQESKLGFDLGLDGSITEDAWWVFLAMRDGFRLGWVDGFLEEQATESVGDFLKQRRRWMYGLMKVMFLNPAPIRYRMVFFFFMMKWILAPFLAPLQVGYIVILIMHDLGLPMSIRVLSLFNVAMIFYSYVIGFLMSVREGMQVRRRAVPFWAVALIFLIPFFQIMEVAALFMSFFARFSKTGRGFHVVEKTVLKENEKRTDMS